MIALVPDPITLCAQCGEPTDGADLCAPCAAACRPMADACRALAEQLYVPDGSARSVRIDLESDGPGRVTASARVYGDHPRQIAQGATALAAYAALRDDLCDSAEDLIADLADTVRRARGIE